MSPRFIESPLQMIKWTKVWTPLICEQPPPSQQCCSLPLSKLRNNFNTRILKQQKYTPRKKSETLVDYRISSTTVNQSGKRREFHDLKETSLHHLVEFYNRKIYLQRRNPLIVHLKNHQSHYSSHKKKTIASFFMKTIKVI